MRLTFPVSALALLLLSAPVAAFAQSPPPAETKEARDARMGWWREARFGMFIHWGLYCEPAGIWKGTPYGGNGEWIMNHAKIPVADYQALAGTFNPVKFNADDFVAVARNAGMKYIVITAKHHDGFAMFKSAHPFNVVDATPFKRDVIKELADACQKQGMKFGFYYSQDQDWTAPGAAAMGKAGHWDPAAQDGDFAQYIHTKALPQVKELLTNYAPFPAVLWFDTPTKEMTPELAREFVDVLKEHPQIIWNNRLGGGFKGDTETPEQTIPATGFKDRDWETCMTINNTWGYTSTDTNFKSAETLLRNLIDIASKGGNYLLNVGPTAEGLIPAPEVERLAQIGQWLKVNGDAIYGTGPTPFGAEAGALSATEKDKNGKPVFKAAWDWRCTSKPGKLFVSLFKWPSGEFRLPAIKSKVTKAYLLADPGKALEVVQGDTGITVTLPAKAPDPLASVLALEIDGPAK